ncbi:MAG: hypothetical protein IPJ75_05490 [Ignavibacteriales bacterium]|nr:hypothetical protein [Ignavibacteriales bacterium]
MMSSTIMNKEVTIRAGLFDDDQNQTVNTFEYNREEILRTPGAGGDIFRAIETLPGLAVQVVSLLHFL